MPKPRKSTNNVTIRAGKRERLTPDVFGKDGMIIANNGTGSILVHVKRATDTSPRTFFTFSIAPRATLVFPGFGKGSQLVLTAEAIKVDATVSWNLVPAK